MIDRTKCYFRGTGTDPTDDPTDWEPLECALARSPALVCVGRFSTGEEALERLPKRQVDAVLMDARLPGMSGIDCTRQLKRVMPGVSIIILTDLPDMRALRASLTAGADGFLEKPISCEECAAAIRFALAGGVPLARSMICRLSELLASRSREPPLSIPLTEREVKVMEHVAGLANWPDQVDGAGRGEELV